MADDLRTTGTAGAELATPITPPSAQTVPAVETAQEKPAEPKYVTKEELDQIMAETLRRAKQSDRDRMKQIDEKLTTIKTRLESGGTQLTQQQVNVLREQIEEEVIPTSPAEQKVDAPASALPPEVQAQVDYIHAQLDATFADVGVTVLPSDPEWKAIKEVMDDPNGSLSKLIRIAAKQAEAKQERTASLKEGAAARVISGGPTQSGEGNLTESAHDAWQSVYKK